MATSDSPQSRKKESEEEFFKQLHGNYQTIAQERHAAYQYERGQHQLWRAIALANVLLLIVMTPALLWLLRREVAQEGVLQLQFAKQSQELQAEQAKSRDLTIRVQRQAAEISKSSQEIKEWRTRATAAEELMATPQHYMTRDCADDLRSAFKELELAKRVAAR